VGIVLGSQVLTGLIISMHYKSKASIAFEVVVNIRREIKDG
jgi:quinol-cytochrome oxidoreductase complex cytochrome b subunit